jgi:hypothetical protein
MITAVPSVIRLVTAATWARCTIGSTTGVVGSIGEPGAVGSTTWSWAHHDP